MIRNKFVFLVFVFISCFISISCYKAENKSDENSQDADVDSDTNGDSHMGSDADADTDTDSDTDTDADTDSDVDTDTDGDADTDTDTDTDADTDVYPDDSYLTLDWASIVGSDNGKYMEDISPRSVVAVEDGSAVVSGRFYGVSTFNGKIIKSKDNLNEPSNGCWGKGTPPRCYGHFVAKYLADGTPAWTERVASGIEAFGGIAVSADGSIYGAGTHKSQAQFGIGNTSISLNSTCASVDTYCSGNCCLDVFITKLDSNGQILWAKKAMINSSNGCDSDGVTENITALTDGSILLSGFLKGPATFGDGISSITYDSPCSSCDDTCNMALFHAKYSADGEIEWFETIQSDRIFETGHPVALADGAMLVSGEYDSTISFGKGTQAVEFSHEGEDHSKTYAYFSKYNSDGSLAWAKDVTIERPDQESYKTPRIGAVGLEDGSMITTWVYEKYKEDTLTIIAKYSSEGTLEWEKNAIIGNSKAEITISKQGNVFAIGILSKGTIGDGADAVEIDKPLGISWFNAKFLSDGSLAWTDNLASETVFSMSGSTLFAYGQFVREKTLGSGDNTIELDRSDCSHTDQQFCSSTCYCNHLYLSKYSLD